MSTGAGGSRRPSAPVDASPTPGFWEVTATMRLDGAPVEVTAAFEVLRGHQRPAVGDPATRADDPLAGYPGDHPTANDSASLQEA